MQFNFLDFFRDSPLFKKDLRNRIIIAGNPRLRLNAPTETVIICYTAICGASRLCNRFARRLAGGEKGTAIFSACFCSYAAHDMLFVLNLFGKRPYPAFRAMNLSLHYLGQMLICITIAPMR